MFHNIKHRIEFLQDAKILNFECYSCGVRGHTAT